MGLRCRVGWGGHMVFSGGLYFLITQLLSTFPSSSYVRRCSVTFPMVRLNVGNYSWLHLLLPMYPHPVYQWFMPVDYKNFRRPVIWSKFHNSTNLTRRILGVVLKIVIVYYCAFVMKTCLWGA